MAELPDGWSDCTAKMDDDPGAVRDIVPGDWHPWLAWIDAGEVTCIDDQNNEVDPPDEVAAWLKQQAAKVAPRASLSSSWPNVNSPSSAPRKGRKL